MILVLRMEDNPTVCSLWKLQRTVRLQNCKGVHLTSTYRSLSQVYWAGPLAGGVTSGLLYEYIFDPSRGRRRPILPEEPVNYPDLEEG